MDGEPTHPWLLVGTRTLCYRSISVDWRSSSPVLVQVKHLDPAHLPNGKGSGCIDGHETCFGQNNLDLHVGSSGKRLACEPPARPFRVALLMRALA